MAVSSIVALPELLMEMPQVCCSAEAPKKRRRASPDEEGRSSLVVAKAVRGFLKELPAQMICGAEMLSAINATLQSLLLEAASRAHDNGRKTLKPADL